LNTCSDMNVHLYDSPAHFVKLDARNGYFVVNIKAEVVFAYIFGFLLSQGNVAALIR